jgi:hypothetical protein
MSPPSGRTWLLNLLLAAGSFAFCGIVLAAAEYACRLLAPDYLYQLTAEESSNVYSETYGWDLRKGFRGLDFGRIATVNEDGYRGARHPFEKPPGRKRVVMVGDSIGYGAGVDDRETFGALLESQHPDLEVVNLSVGGYGTDQELIKLERQGLRYHPDVVVLHFCLFSDFTDNALPSALFDARQPKPFFTWDAGALVEHAGHLKLSPPRKLAQWLSDYSHLYNRLRVLLKGRRPPREPGVWADRKAAVEANLPPAAELTFELVRRMNARSREAGARFLVVIHPDEFAYKHRSRLLRKFCTTPALEGIPVIEMGARYRERGLRFGDFALDEPGHLTKRGHEIAAETLAALITGPPPPEWDYRQTCRADLPSDAADKK